MTMNAETPSRSLPAEFGELEPYVEKWNVEPLSRRQQARISSSLQDLRSFYDAMMSRGDEAIEYLNSVDLNDPPPEAKALLNMMRSLMEVSHSVELWDRVDQPGAYDFDRVKFVLDQ
ncbi:hypothetical protein VVT58_24045 (plasmid) [Sphingobium sp. SJ10-10]|uniref:hypothetical protein n=1 Tax=Sphingobium sp. SJ10-10 TaxID=3114999 RepID=UPI002E16CE1C|nr:hypothetical protein [Sphingobium sp. SJ10-10]